MPALTHQYHYEPATRTDAPSLLLLHGTGGNEHDLLPLGRTLSPGSALLSPRGMVSERGANRFFARLAEGVFDPAEVARRTHELADFISAASKEHGLPPGKLIAVGFSNGANVAATLLQLRPETMAGAVLLRPMVVLNQPATAGSLAGKRVLIASGNHDRIVPLEHAENLADLLRAGGAEVQVHTSTAGHNLTSTDIAAAKEFFAD